MIDKISLNTARAIKRNAPDHPTSEAVLKYALEVVYNAVFIIGITLIISLWTGKTKEALLVMGAFALLRQLSGGLHLKSGIACVVVSSSLFTALSVINIGDSSNLLNVISLILALVFAPSGIENQTRIPKKYFPLLKLMSAMFVIISMFINNPAVSLAVFVQSVTLISRKGVK